jgi:methionine-rich copper-binding protein CopC
LIRAPKRSILSSAALSLALFAMSAGRLAQAHAELESSSPAAGSTVQALPATLTLVFSEEVQPGSEVVEVTGPNGSRVDTGDAAVDLTDPERRTVHAALFGGGAGPYSVHWQNVSNIDGDESEGDFTFTVDPAAAPVSPSPEATLDPGAYGNPLKEEGDFDSRAFAISVGAGLIALIAIVGFWFVVRPRNPRFGPRAGRDRE